MEAKFKTGDVVVIDDINVSMFEMTVETVITPVESFECYQYQYKCAFFELGKLYREWFREDQLLFKHEFIQKRICEDRDYKLNKILREV